MKYTTLGSTMASMDDRRSRPSIRREEGCAEEFGQGIPDSRRSRLSRVLRRSTAAVGLAGVAAASLAVAVPGGAPASASVSKSTTILLVHGFDGGSLLGLDLPFDSAIDCTGPTMKAWKNGLIARGFTDVRTVGYYKGDTNCDLFVPGRSNNSVNTSVVELGKEFANLVATTFTSQNRTVAVSAHSMGGLVTRQALAGTSAGQAGFPTALRIADVVTSGTPHNGALASRFCPDFTGTLLPLQCRQLAANSAFLNGLAHNPQGVNGTDWTLIGSECDDVASAVSATTMNRVSTARPAIAKTIFTAPSVIEGGCLLGSLGFDHVELLTKSAPLSRIATGLTTSS